jgi:3-dehydroquinate synthase
MEELIIKDSRSEYKVFLESSFKGLNGSITQYCMNSSQKFFVVADSTVAELYKEVFCSLKQDLDAKIFILPEGEDNKNIQTISRLYDFLIENEADRSSTLIAVGGGVTGDLTGFAAATFMRGIKFINIPTTLTAQVDSCIGGKTGYNYGGVKNMVGAFYNPEFVYLSTHFLKTLSKKQLLDGMGEIIKYALIWDKRLLEFIEEHYEEILELDRDKILFIIKECLSIKADVIAKDYNDKELRNILNFGHTVGHGIEIDSSYSVPHGIAVALGMLTALKLSEEELGLSSDVYAQVEDLYKKIGIPNKYKVDNHSAFLYAIRHDKKNLKDINFVLLKDIGSCIIKIPVAEERILKAIKNSIGCIQHKEE